MPTFVGPTPDYWATLISLPTATPAASTGGTTAQECELVDGLFTCGNIPLVGRNPISCPINEVMRVPYPRSIVVETTKFNLVPAQWFPSEDGKWSEPPSNAANIADFIDSNGLPIREGIYRNIQLGLRGERLKKEQEWPPRSFIKPTAPFQIPEIVPDVKWTFTGRSAKGDLAVQFGLTTTYAYAAASYVGADAATGAVPNRGRRFDFAARQPGNTYDLPAYPVNLLSYCGFWQGIRGEISKKEWISESTCENKPVDADGKPYMPAGTSDEKCFNGQISYGHYAFYWSRFQTAWQPKDLREENWPTSYVYEDRATAGGGFAGREWKEPYGNGVFVPVIEVQTVQQDQ